MEYVYVLQLEGGRYYIGKTTDILSRFILHMKRRGSSFTRKYRVIDIELFKKCAGPFDEDNLTKEYMYKYGIEYVRGGSYTSEILEEYQLRSLEKELCTAYNKCYSCGKSGHVYMQDICNEVNNIRNERKTKVIYDRWLNVLM